MVVDVESLTLAELPPSDELLFCFKGLDRLLDAKQIITYAYRICKQKGQAFLEHVFTAWIAALRGLSRHEVNTFGGQEATLRRETFLNRCLALLKALDDAEDFMRAEDPFSGRHLQDFHDGQYPGDPFEDFLHRSFADAVISTVREKLDAQTLEKPCKFLGEETFKSYLWKLVKEKCWHRGCKRCFGGLRDGLGADLMMALIQKGLPRWCWAGRVGPCNDNLLQYIIEPATSIAAMDGKEEAEARLCMFLAERLSLEELCHQNDDGRNALSYAEEFVGRHVRVHHDLWIQVRDKIREQMEAGLREFQGSLLALVEVARSIRAGLGGNSPLLSSFCLARYFWAWHTWPPAQ